MGSTAPPSRLFNADRGVPGGTLIPPMRSNHVAVRLPGAQGRPGRWTMSAGRLIHAREPQPTRGGPRVKLCAARARSGRRGDGIRGHFHKRRSRARVIPSSRLALDGGGFAREGGLLDLPTRGRTAGRAAARDRCSRSSRLVIQVGRFYHPPRGRGHIPARDSTFALTPILRDDGRR